MYQLGTPPLAPSGKRSDWGETEMVGAAGYFQGEDARIEVVYQGPLLHLPVGNDHLALVALSIPRKSRDDEGWTGHGSVLKWGKGCR